MPTNKKSEHSLDEHISNFNLVFHKETKVKSVIEKIKNNPENWSNIEQVIVVDTDNKYLGVVELQNLLASGGDITLENLVSENYPYVRHHYHQSHIAKIALVHGSENIPVLDDENKFVGIVDAAQILKILHEEHIEKLMHFSGILNNETLLSGYKARIWNAAKARLPWLLFGLIGGGISTFIVQSFSRTLQTQIALAFFIPVIVYMNDAVGTQAQTVIVRNTVLEKIHIMKSLIFEVKVTFIIGFVLSLIMFIFAALWLDPIVATVVSTSMFLGILSSAIIGTVIPWMLERSGKDPAIGSGPFTTILQDLLSILIYFSIASALL